MLDGSPLSERGRSVDPAVRREVGHGPPVAGTAGWPTPTGAAAGPSPAAAAPRAGRSPAHSAIAAQEVALANTAHTATPGIVVNRCRTPRGRASLTAARASGKLSGTS
jgi:hypothetical protein